MGGGGNRGGGSTPPPYVPPIQAAVRPKSVRKGSYRGANILTQDNLGTTLGSAPIAKTNLG